MSENASSHDPFPEVDPTPQRALPQSYFIVSWSLIALNVLVYLAMCLKGVSPMSPSPAQVLPWGADFGPLTLNGQWWRILTSTFVHFGIIHIGMNMYILYQVGPFTELLFGRIRFLLLYLLAGVGGSIVSLYVHPFSVGAGASGAIFGVYGALLAFLFVERGVIPRSRSIVIAKSAGIFLLYNLFFGLASRTTDLSAHGGGFVVGLIVGALLARPAVPGTRRLPMVRIIAAAVIGGLVTAGSLRALARHNNFTGGVLQQALLGANVPLGDKGHVIYAGSATKAEAERLAQALAEGDLGKNPDIDVLLSKGSGGTHLYFPVGNDAWNRPGVAEGFAEVVRAAAPAVGGLPITVHLTDDAFQSKKSVVVQ